jgi:hypothetical protein
MCTFVHIYQTSEETTASIIAYKSRRLGEEGEAPHNTPENVWPILGFPTLIDSLANPVPVVPSLSPTFSLRLTFYPKSGCSRFIRNTGTYQNPRRPILRESNIYVFDIRP